MPEWRQEQVERRAVGCVCRRQRWRSTVCASIPTPPIWAGDRRENDFGCFGESTVEPGGIIAQGAGVAGVGDRRPADLGVDGSVGTDRSEEVRDSDHGRKRVIVRLTRNKKAHVRPRACERW